MNYSKKDLDSIARWLAQQFGVVSDYVDYCNEELKTKPSGSKRLDRFKGAVCKEYLIHQIDAVKKLKDGR